MNADFKRCIHIFLRINIFNYQYLQQKQKLRSPQNPKDKKKNYKKSEGELQVQFRISRIKMVIFLSGKTPVDWQETDIATDPRSDSERSW